MDQMRSIFLVGYMGAGKSLVGQALADRLGLRFIDLDAEISRRLGTPISEIFARNGESTFRAAEHDELERCAELVDSVVATGGGAFCSEANREVIHRSGGVSVFLDLPWKALEHRLTRDHRARPMYEDANQAKQLFEERLSHYGCALVRVSLTGDENPDEVAGRVVESLREAPCAT
jgi:shikimate kinase